jgi:hypothetical protein
MTHGSGPTTENADHCHSTNVPRGLLCRICNTGLGMYESHQRPRGLRFEPYESYLAAPPARANRSGLMPVDGSLPEGPGRSGKVGKKLRVPRRPCSQSSVL